MTKKVSKKKVIVRKLIIADKVIQPTYKFICSWCGVSEGVGFSGDPIKVFNRNYKRAPGVRVLDWKWEVPLLGRSKKVIIGDPKYDVLYVRDYDNDGLKDIVAPAICQNCCKQLAKYKEEK